jgi:hypothetical protein
VIAPEIVASVLRFALPTKLVCVIFGIRALEMWLSYLLRREFFRLRHIERMAAIEKSTEVGPSVPNVRPADPQDPRSMGRSSPLL